MKETQNCNLDACISDKDIREGPEYDKSIDKGRRGTGVPVAVIIGAVVGIIVGATLLGFAISYAMSSGGADGPPGTYQQL